MDKEIFLLDNTWIHEWLGQGSTFNKTNVPKGSSALGADISPKKKNSSPFRDGNLSLSPHKIIGKRGPPPEDVNTSVSRKKRRIDVTQGPQGRAVSNDLSPTKRGPRIAELLPIQHDSWHHLPEMWEYCGPDGRRIKERKWSPNMDGDHTSTYQSDRLHQNGDRKNATAATVTAWVELNRLRMRYQELVAAFHGGPLVVHHLADRESEQQFTSIAQASTEVEKAMADVGRASSPFPRLSWAAAAVPPEESRTKRRASMAVYFIPPASVAPQDTLLAVAPPEEVASVQRLAPVGHSAIPSVPLAPASPPSPPKKAAVASIVIAPTIPPTIQPMSSATPSKHQPPQQARTMPGLTLPTNAGPEAPIATPSNVLSSTKATKRMQKATPTVQSTTPPSTPSTPLSVVSSTGQFRFTPTGEARFKLLCAQGKYDEMYEMLPAEQHFDHITTPSAIAAFRSDHPRPNKGGSGKQNMETELWVCKAKVKIERRELPKVNKGDVTEELSIVYSDDPCNGVVGTTSNMVRHKKRTHLARPYESNATEESGGKKQKK